MKNILTIVLCALFSMSAQAEYDGHHIEFEIETFDGTLVKGYVNRISMYYHSDTMSYAEYLEYNRGMIFLGSSSDEGTYILFYKHLLRYEYKNRYNADKKSVICTLVDEQQILESSIKSVKVINIIDFSYTESLGNIFSIDDLEWTNTEVVDKLSLGGHLCNHELFIHQKSGEVYAVFEELEAYRIIYDKKVALLTEIVESADGPLHWAAREELEEMEEEMDDDIFEIIGKLSGLKVVIISYCYG